MITRKDIKEREKMLKTYDILLTHAFRLPVHTVHFDDIEEYGLCHANGKIQIRMVNFNGRKLLSLRHMTDTLCHELAHLIHEEHKNPHRRLTTAMHEWLKRNV
jgi:hypothetical protein